MTANPLGDKIVSSFLVILFPSNIFSLDKFTPQQSQWLPQLC